MADPPKDANAIQNTQDIPNTKPSNSPESQNNIADHDEKKEVTSEEVNHVTNIATMQASLSTDEVGDDDVRHELEVEEVVEVEEVEDNGVPVDRGWAWMIVLATFGMHILVVGGVKSFGVLFVEFQDKYHVTARELGMIQGMAMTFMMGLGLVANLLAVKFTCRVVVFVGGFLTALGFVLSASIPSFGWLYVTYGVITGTGFALSYSPCVVMVGFYFKKRRSLANGISVSGSGVGSFALPNIMRWMMNKYGLNGCLLILGAMMLNVCACALIFRPLSSYKPKTKRIISKTNYSRKKDEESELLMVKKPALIVKELLINSKSELKGDTESYYSEISLNKHSHTEDFINENGSHQRLDIPARTVKSTLTVSNGDIFMASLQSIPQEDLENIATDSYVKLKSCPCCFGKQKVGKPAKEKGPKLFNWSLLSNPVFLIYALSCGLANFGYPNIFFMLPAYAESNGQSRDSSALLVSIIGITDLIGRLFFGWFSDLKIVPRRVGFVGCMAASAVLNLTAPFMVTFAAMATFACLYGLCAGSYIALIAVMLADALGLEKLSSSFGLTALAMSLSLMPGPLICGSIRDSTMKWDYAFVFCGILTLAGAVLPLFEPCAQRSIQRKEQETSGNIAKKDQDV